ncbi:hypothetical protein ABW20_dc0109772 [Dactylellina cionopaga]|nr:hypothetical protein ABW20_dc0109772 [Dactylellina cionopaga]
MSSSLSREAMTVTRGGQVIVFVSDIKTKEVPSLSRQSSAPQETRTATLSQEHTASESGALTFQAPTTFITRTHPASRPVVVVTQVITLTTPPAPPETSIISLESSSIFTRPAESRPPVVPYLIGPFIASEGASPLETGEGVHTPPPQFNGLAASPGVIAGTFAAIVGVGIMCMLACMLQRKRQEHKFLAGHNGRDNGPPVLPPINRYLNSPVWFGRRHKSSSTELKHLPAGSITSGTGAPSVSTMRDHMIQRPSAIEDVAKTQHDLEKDILTTTGMATDRKENHYNQANRDVESVPEKADSIKSMKEVGCEIGLAVTKPETDAKRSRPLPVTVEDGEEVQQAVNLQGAPYLFCELEDTSPVDRYHSFVH